jgi:hypothetical protein
VTGHDTTRLQELGQLRRDLEAQIKALDAELDPLIYAAAHATPRVPQVDIMAWTGHSKETVRRKEMSPEQLAAERERRRAKGKTS